MKKYSNYCYKCNRPIRDIPFKCKFCHKIHCPKHRLPEDHDCKELEDYKSRRHEKWVSIIEEVKRGRHQGESWQREPQEIYVENAPSLPVRIEKKYGWIKKPRRQIDFLKFFTHLTVILLVFAPIYYLAGLPIPFVNQCDNGTIYGHCSWERPFYCSNGTLVKNSTHCGCPIDYVINGNDCLIKYEINPKQIKLTYFNFIVYGGLNDYLAGLPSAITYYSGSPAPTTKTFIMRDLDNSIQREYLLQLVGEIKMRNPNDPKRQAEMAIRIVQSIPYDWVGFSGTPEGRMPYEVLYDMKGVCGEKSLLLVFLLREIGFGTATFEFGDIHRAVGIKCDKGNYNSDYCFIESTDVYPIGQIPANYVGGVNIRGMTPQIIVVSDGLSYK